MRGEKEFQRIRAYIEENPVHAGLVAAAEDYTWSSAARALQDDAGLKPGAA